MTKEELKEKYSKFIADVSEILGLGKPIDILKLCQITDRFFRPLQDKVTDLEKENAELEKENARLKLELEALDGQIPWKDIKDKSEVLGKLTKAKELLKRSYENYIYLEPIRSEIEQFLKE